MSNPLPSEHLLTCGEQVLPVRFRMLGPADAPKLIAGFAKLSAETRRKRFLGSKKALDETDIVELTTDDDQHGAIGVALLDARREEIEGIGVARYRRLVDAETVAELGITIADAFQGCGLGSRLMAIAVDRLRELGVAQISGQVLADNDGAWALLRRHTHSINSTLEEGVEYFIASIVRQEYTDLDR